MEWSAGIVSAASPTWLPSDGIGAVNAKEYRGLLDTLLYGKRLPDAIYLLDPGEDATAISPKLRITVGELGSAWISDRPSTRNLWFCPAAIRGKLTLDL